VLFAVFDLILGEISEYNSPSCMPNELAKESIIA